MVNILLAIRLFAFKWKRCKIRMRCDNQVVVQVLRSGRTKDPFLAVCTPDIWFWAARFNMDMRYDHIQGVNNRVADLLIWLTERVGCFASVVTSVRGQCC